MPNFGRCRGCHATIRWETTVKGKSIPLDVDPAMDGNLELREIRIQGPGPMPTRGVVRAVVVKPEDPPTDVRYKSHFATCPARQQFRKGEAQRARRRAQGRAQAAIDRGPTLDQVDGEDLAAAASLEAVQRSHRAPGGGVE